MSNQEKVYDFAVIGAGIAGASVASELAKDATVILFEMESQPGYHTTGRSAAMLAPDYGPAPIRALTRASTSFMTDPPEGFTNTNLLSSCEAMMVARRDQLPSLDAFISEVGGPSNVQRLNEQEILARHPMFREGYVAAGTLDVTAKSIDVHALHHGFLNAFKARNGELRTNAEVKGLSRNNGIWDIQTGDFTVQAKTVINTAGAWADALGQLAGAEEIGLVPKRRTVLMVDAPVSIDTNGIPMVIDIDEEFYMKPDAGRLLISPANEDPVAPSDVQPDEMDIAICIDRITRAFDIEVKHISNKWAGLRSFVGDKCPVVGYSNQAEGFFWLAGQGGYGIQSSPGLSRVAAAQVLRRDLPQDVIDQGLQLADILPQRVSIIK